MFSEVLECVLAQNGGRFVWKRNAFCSKMEDVLYQNAFRFAIKRRRKMENAYAQYSLHYPHDYCKMLALVIPKNNIFFAITSAFQHYLLSLQANNSS